MMNLSSLAGSIHLLSAMIYLGASIVTYNSKTSTKTSTRRILQIVIVPLVLFISGVILLLYGWRLDPIVGLQQLLITGLLIYLIIHDLKSRD